MITTYKEIERQLLRLQDRLSAIRGNITACTEATDSNGALILPLDALGREIEWLEWFRKEIAETKREARRNEK